MLQMCLCLQPLFTILSQADISMGTNLMILFVRFAFVVRPSKFVGILKDQMDVDFYAILIVFIFAI